MKTLSPVWEALAKEYERRHAGRTGQGKLDVQVEFGKLLKLAHCDDDAAAVAEQQFRALDGKIIELEFIHPRDPSRISKVRLAPDKEGEFFRHIGRPAPSAVRQELAAMFTQAARDVAIPERWRRNWQHWCERMRETSLTGASLAPLDRTPSAENAELLDLLPRLLAWNSESLARFASCVLCDHSKRLEELAPCATEGPDAGLFRGKLGRLIEDITGGEIRSLNDLGILPNPRSVLVHGQLRLQLDGEWLNLGMLSGAVRLSKTDIDCALAIETSARRCLTVENEATFHELAKLRSGELLLQTSYPGSATIAFLKKLSGATEFWHFGDSDEDGFKIFDVLRGKSGRDFQSLHMQRGRMLFEQESLGLPRLPWPFYFS